MRYSSRQLEKLQQKQEQFYPVPWVPEVFFSFISFFQFVIHDGLKKTARKKKKFWNVAERLFYRTCSYFENGPLAIGLNNLKKQPKRQHHI